MRPSSLPLIYAPRHAVQMLTLVHEEKPDKMRSNTVNYAETWATMSGYILS